MTLLELVSHLRRSVLEDTGGTGVSWQDLSEDDAAASQLRWTNEELTSFINEAERQACRASFLIKESNSKYYVTVTAGTSEYPLSPKIIRIKGARLTSTGKPLDRAEIEDVWETQNYNTLASTPTHYIPDYQTGKITLYPQPVVNDTLNLLYYRLPAKDMSWEGAESDAPEIAVPYQIPMLNYAAFLAYQKEDANTFDPKRSEYFRQLFERDFGHTSVYGEVRRARTRNKGVSYGGIN